LKLYHWAISYLPTMLITAWNFPLQNSIQMAQNLLDHLSKIAINFQLVWTYILPLNLVCV